MRRPPQSNYPPGTVPHPDHGCGLGTQHMQSGISRLAPPEPESELHSLPPILRNTCQVPIPRCSKGPRGLSVLPRVTSIFTRSAISPSPQLRQCPSRYAIRAGRNLPDKEFRSSASPRRRTGQTIPSSDNSVGALVVVVEVGRSSAQPADLPHRSDFHCPHPKSNDEG